MHAPFTRLGGPAVLVLLAMSGGCAAGDRPTPATGAPGVAQAAGDAEPGQARAARFIVRFRAGSGPAAAPQQVQPYLDALAGREDLPALEWQRRLAVGADVFTAEGPLDGPARERLMRALQAAPEVEYVEPDAMATIPPGEVPPPQPLR